MQGINFRTVCRLAGARLGSEESEAIFTCLRQQNSWRIPEGGNIPVVWGRYYAGRECVYIPHPLHPSWTPILWVTTVTTDRCFDTKITYFPVLSSIITFTSSSNSTLHSITTSICYNCLLGWVFRLYFCRKRWLLISRFCYWIVFI